MNELLSELKTHVGEDALSAMLEIAGEDAEDALEQALHDIIGGKSASVLLREFELGEYGWKHSSFKNEQNEELEQNEFITKPISVEEGVLECRCGSRRVFSFTKQSRSADESTSVYARCVSCNASWRT